MSVSKSPSKLVLFLLCAAVIIIAVVLLYPREDPVLRQIQMKKVVCGFGYVRGTSRVILRNKYAGFIEKVYFYSQNRVKKGDVILSYDDYDIRKKISDKKHEITLQKEDIAYKELALRQKRIDPLPSNYRNLQIRQNAAMALAQRMKHEQNVYKTLHKTHSVSTLSMMEKEQNAISSVSDLNQIKEDIKVVQSGLAEICIAIAEQDLHNSKQRLVNLEEDLKLLEEEQKYYKIVAPYDGICITNSDTPYCYDSAGTSAAEIHKDHKKKVYAYFREEDMGYIKENVPCSFRSNLYPDKDCNFKLLPYEIKKDRYTYGDKCYFLIKFHVIKEPKPLRIDSTGFVEVSAN